MRQTWQDMPDSFYLEAIARILAQPLPPMPETVRGDVAYAHARMRMAARCDGELLDNAVRQALYLALRANEKGISPKARAHRLRLAARAALGLGHGLPPGERTAYMRRIGRAAACLSRLIYENKETIV